MKASDTARGKCFFIILRFLEIEVEMIDAELPLTKAAKVGKTAATRKTSRYAIITLRQYETKMRHVRNVPDTAARGG
jgi:hypothetical protein